MDVVFKTVIRNNSDKERKLHWAQPVRIIPAGGSLILEGCYPNDCKTTMARKGLLAELAAGATSLFYATNMKTVGLGDVEATLLTLVTDGRKMAGTTKQTVTEPLAELPSLVDDMLKVVESQVEKAKALVASKTDKSLFAVETKDPNKPGALENQVFAEGTLEDFTPPKQAFSEADAKSMQEETPTFEFGGKPSQPRATPPLPSTGKSPMTAKATATMKAGGKKG